MGETLDSPALLALGDQPAGPAAIIHEPAASWALTGGTRTFMMGQGLELGFGFYTVRVIAGRAKGARLIAKAPGVRPTASRVRSALFSALGPGVVEGSCVLDLYAGTGALGIEALSRGASFTCFVERERRQCGAIRASLKAARLDGHATVSCMNVMKFLQGAEDPFGLVIADPPYSEDAGGALAALVARDLVLPLGTVVLEHSSRVAPPAPVGLLLGSSRRYGDTALSFYTLASSQEHKKETQLKS